MDCPSLVQGSSSIHLSAFMLRKARIPYKETDCVAYYTISSQPSDYNVTGISRNVVGLTELILGPPKKTFE